MIMYYISTCSKCPVWIERNSWGWYANDLCVLARAGLELEKCLCLAYLSAYCVLFCLQPESEYILCELDSSLPLECIDSTYPWEALVHNWSLLVALSDKNE